MADQRNLRAAADAAPPPGAAPPSSAPAPPPPWWQAADPAITAGAVVGDVLAGVTAAAAAAACERRLRAAEPAHLLRRVLADVRRSVNAALPAHDCGTSGPPAAGVFSGYMAPLAGAQHAGDGPRGVWALGDVDEPPGAPIDSWARGVVPLRQRQRPPSAARLARTRPEPRLAAPAVGARSAARPLAGRGRRGGGGAAGRLA